MDCIMCMNLRHNFESQLARYVEARSGAYYSVSTKLAARRNVDIERAWNDLEEHQLECMCHAKVRRLDQYHQSFR